MNIKCIVALILFYLPFSLNADDSFYCPQKHGYIRIGMTTEQVIAACGQPLSQQDSRKPITVRIPVTQLMYNNQGADTAFYGVWNIPTGSAGTPLQVNIVNQRVKSVEVNNQSSNAFSVCGGVSIQIGDPASKVYGACGSPSAINSTFIEQPVPTATKPQIWIYQLGQYQSTVSLTFVDGKLQSINQ
jgi:hypothetical protein